MDPEDSKPTNDVTSVALLLVLYTLQGIPMGLSGAVPLLLAGKVNYRDQALFSLSSLPFSIKLLWAPIVDSTRFGSYGKRKSWLIPTQLCIGAVMVGAQPFINSWMDGNIQALTALFFTLYLLCATQDIAVDGWALTMLSKKNVGWGPTCNTLGQSLGYALSYVGFVALQQGGLVSLASFVGACGWAFLVTTLFLLFKKEEDSPSESPWLAYQQAARTLRLAPVRRLCFVLLTCKAAFGAADAATALKAVEYGLPKEDIAFLSPLLLTASVVLPVLCVKWTNGPRPLLAFLAGVPIRLLLNPLTWAFLVYLRNRGRRAFLLFALLSLFREFGSTLMFVSQMSFFARIADPDFGGTYMTLLNTVANLGGKWPPSLALYFIDGFTTETTDGFAIELVVCSIVGIVWLVVVAPIIYNLQAVPLDRWRDSAKKNGHNGARD